jgi:hypothetical protein
MAKLAYEADIIAELGPISGMHKLLYLTLWSRANEIGHIVANMDMILGLTGIRYQYEDLLHFGNRVKVLDGNEVILSRYLKTTIGTFSRTMKVQTKMWRQLELRWKATKDNLTPFIEAWRELDILKFAPEYPDEYVEGMPPPTWMANHRRELELSLSVDTPPGWSDRIRDEFRKFVAYRVALGREKTSKAEAAKVRLTPSQVMNFQSIVQEMINDGMPEKKIIKQIQYPENHNKIAIYLP